ncbi:MAG: TonB-dependent receptor plug domain-containing protein, partial [Chlorobiales bacterium]|nr:TonB-dependent receptor plug domain-containing protein [Chlorobiales bacterium]
MKKLILILLLSLVLPASMFGLGSTGRLTGTVQDKASQEPLAGALVELQQTGFKAVTDTAGKFTFLNLPVGAYTLEVSLVTYARVKVEDVKVSADLTTLQNIELPVLTALTEELVVTAERPLIDQAATTKSLVFTTEKINEVPLRGVRQIVGLSPGVVQNERDDDKMYLRGGRNGEVAFYVDGILQNSPIDNTVSGEISNSALQEIVVESSYDAQYGNAASGIINATTKNPSADRYAVRAEAITDGFIPENEARLGLTGYGYALYNLSLSGPIIPGNNALSFYGLVERQNLADAVPTEGFGVRPGAGLKLWNAVWKLRYDPQQSFKIDIGGNYTASSLRFFSRQRGYDEYAVERRDESGELLGYDFIKGNSSENGRRDENRVLQLYARYTQPLGKLAYLTIQGHYSGTETEVGDNRYWNDFDKYQENGAIGQDAFDLVNLPGNPFNAYWKESVDFYELRTDFEAQTGSHNLKTGGQFRYHSYKLVEFRPEVSRENDTQVNLIGYSPEDIGYAPFTQFYKDNPDLINSETDGARHPIIASFYMRDLIELK